MDLDGEVNISISTSDVLGWSLIEGERSIGHLLPRGVSSSLSNDEEVFYDL